MTLQQLYDFIDLLAPFETQLDFDNSGLLVGDRSMTITGIHVALDLTDAVLDEAIAHGANVIVTHHPLMFHPIQSLTADNAEARLLQRLIKADFGLISAHTNLDRAPGGMNDVLAAAAGLTHVSGEGFLRVGDLPAAMTADAYADFLSNALHTTVRRMGPGDGVIHRVGVCSGAGSDDWASAAQAGADGFISGEIRHHHALAAVAEGMVCFECGHHATEEPGIFALADTLQKHADAVQ